MWVVVETGPDAGSALELDGGRTLVLGRQRGCDLIVRDARASRRHAALTAEGAEHVRLRDLGSANGTYVDGSRVDEAVLDAGQEIRIGDVVMTVQRTNTGGEVRRRQRDATTPSGVRRMVRRAHRTALAAAALAVAGVAAAVLLATGAIGGSSDRVPQVVAQLRPATVLVVTQRGGARTGTGSGFVLDARRGLIATDAHVVNQGTAFQVVAAGRARPATVRGVAPCEDLALLQVADARGLHAAPLGSGVQQGETAVALGYSDGGFTATAGVVSAARTSFRDPAPDVPAYPEVVQTDTALNPGDSGGPLANLDGEVIAVDAAARTTGSDGRALQNVNYAIPIGRARRVLAGLAAGRSPAWTGLTFAYPTAADLRAARLPSGLRVTGAIPGTPAAGAAIAPGALLAGIDGHRLDATLSSYCAATAGLRSGDQVVLSFAAPGAALTRQLRLRLG